MGMAQGRGGLGASPAADHDLRRSFISLALADGARRDVLERVTHEALATRAIHLYAMLPEILCNEVLNKCSVCTNGWERRCVGIGAKGRRPARIVTPNARL